MHVECTYKKVPVRVTISTPGDMTTSELVAWYRELDKSDQVQFNSMMINNVDLTELL